MYKLTQIFLLVQLLLFICIVVKYKDSFDPIGRSIVMTFENCLELSKKQTTIVLLHKWQTKLLRVSNCMIKIVVVITLEHHLWCVTLPNSAFHIEMPIQSLQNHFNNTIGEINNHSVNASVPS
jgi:hypothetical protein